MEDALLSSAPGAAFLSPSGAAAIFQLEVSEKSLLFVMLGFKRQQLHRIRAQPAYTRALNFFKAECYYNIQGEKPVVKRELPLKC